MALIMLLVLMSGALLAWILRGIIIYWVEVVISIAAGGFMDLLHL